jgi:hypothetical protein
MISSLKARVLELLTPTRYRWVYFLHFDFFGKTKSKLYDLKQGFVFLYLRGIGATHKVCATFVLVG